jgi:Lantibiotic biosynthesis dehydratase C-term
MHTSALNVYFWDFAEQNRLLTDCLGPAVQRLREKGVLERFWYDRFDTRGPHVTLLLGGPESGVEKVRARLNAVLDDYLKRNPSTREIPQEELELRHKQCRGKHLCSLDLLPGLAPNNSYAWADDAEDEYVLKRTAGMDAGDVNDLLADQALWSIDQLRRGGVTATAIRWAAGLTAALDQAGADPAEFWRFYAASLVLPLRTAITEDNPAVIEGLPRLIGERNQAVFDALWDASLEAAPVWPGMQALAAIIAAEPASRRRSHFVRELIHAVLAQLDQYVRFRIPLSLYAWQRTLPEPAEAVAA